MQKHPFLLVWTFLTALLSPCPLQIHYLSDWHLGWSAWEWHLWHQWQQQWGWQQSCPGRLSSGTGHPECLPSVLSPWPLSAALWTESRVFGSFVHGMEVSWYRCHLCRSSRAVMVRRHWRGGLSTEGSINAQKSECSVCREWGSIYICTIPL